MSTDSPPTVTPARRTAFAMVAIAVLLGALLGLLVAPGIRPHGGESGDQALLRSVRAGLGTQPRGFGEISAFRIVDGQVVFAGVGVNSGDAPSPDTPFELGSITKTWTGMLLADGVTRGELAPTDRLGQHITELKGTRAGGVTLQSLATHTSGLPPMAPTMQAQLVWSVIGGRDTLGGVTAVEVVASAKDLSLGKPGTFAYSNLGVALLGIAEARAARVPDWQALVSARLLTPLGMTSTTFTPRPAGLMQPRQSNGREVEPWSGPGISAAGSSTRTTARDMARFAAAVLNGTAPGMVATKPLARVSTNSQIGLTWLTTQTPAGPMTWHDGGTGGTRTALALDLVRHRATFVATTSDRDVVSVAERALFAGTDSPVTVTADPPDRTAALIALAVLLAFWVSGVVTVVLARHRLGVVLGIVTLLTAVIFGWTMGPWAAVPGLVFTALVGGAFAGTLVGGCRWRHVPTRGEKRRWWTIVQLVAAVLVLGTVALTLPR